MQSNISDCQNFRLTENYSPSTGWQKTRIGTDSEYAVASWRRQSGNGWQSAELLFGWREKSKRFLSAESGLGTRF